MAEAAASICGSPPLSFFSSQLAGQPLSPSLARLPLSRKKFCSFIRSARISSRGPHGAGKSSRELNRQSPWPLDIQEQSLVTALDGDDAAEAKFVEYLRALYAQRPPDLIVALGAPAARFVQQHRADLFPTTPMLLAAVEVRRVEPSMLSEQDAVAGVRFDQVALVENILRLLPETKTIAIIIGNSPAERFWVGEQQRILGPLLKNKVELIFYGEQPFEEILKAGCEFAAPQCNLFSAAGGGRRRCRLWRQGAIEAHL